MNTEILIKSAQNFYSLDDALELVNFFKMCFLADGFFSRTGVNSCTLMYIRKYRVKSC